MKKTCFFISRIGEPESAERKLSDKLLTYIINPVLEPLGFGTPIRADHITKPGTITAQVFTYLWTADLVVADLTGGNANVFYELAVRHLSKKPFVQMIQKDEKLPFDVAPERTIHFDFDVDEVQRVKDSLDAMVKSAEEGPCETTLSRTIEFTFVKDEIPVAKSMIMEILSHIQQIEGELQQQRPARLFGQIAETQNTTLANAFANAFTAGGRDLRTAPPPTMKATVDVALGGTPQKASGLEGAASERWGERGGQ